MDAHLEEPPGREFTIRNVLCAVGLSPHSRNAVSWGGADGRRVWRKADAGPHHSGRGDLWTGGVYAAPEWREALISSAAQQIAKLQEQMGPHAQTFIECGDVPGLLRTAAEQTRADLLVIGRSPTGGRLRISGYAIIREAGVPVLSV